MVLNHNKRNSAIELCRILSMLMIVGCHFATHGGFNFDKATITIPRLWWYVIEMGGNFGVDVFLLISGYFLINNTVLKISVKKILKLWGQVFFYSVAIFVFSVILGINHFSIKQFFQSIFPITTNRWWFATSYFVLFLIHPYINRLLLSLDKKQYQGLMLLLLFIWCIIPTLTTFSLASNELWQFVLIYVIGGYIKLYGNRIKLKSYHFFYLWMAATIVTYLSSIVFMILGKKISILAEHAAYFYGRLSLPTLLRAVFFFMIFERMTLSHSKIVNTVSASAFGVYLLHDNGIIRPLLWKTIFVNAQYQDSLILIPYSIAVALLVYMVCTLIDLIRINTVEVLFMKVVDYCLNRIVTPIERFYTWISKLMFGNE